ncbi:trypsin-like serine protease [Crossiella sp. CA-258035]|uniref:trypsin-like serine protease n=1 Tax=Crossiella sp. CA-258035 TaxID=2981138 RepID=UPI0024BD2A3D|nr:trypsin-like serine protease [Crossiella sp. CA-258035]WHT22176.1 trypsin-like serine protease [Crossiella sp. CA-258035]
MLFPLLAAVPAHAVSGAPAPDGGHRFTVKLDTGDGARACSGALVDPQWVLTAASCFTFEPGETLRPGPPSRPARATVGRTALSQTGGQVLGVAYLVPRADRNVVLAKLAHRVLDVPVVPIGGAPAVGEKLSVAGFGRTATEWTPDRLHAAPFTVGAVGATTVDLTGDGANTGVCKGDSGGPAFRERDGRAELVALHHTSWQRGCLGETEQRNLAVESRVDDLAGWVRERIAADDPDPGPGTGPAALAAGDQLNFFGRGTDNQLHRWWYAPGQPTQREVLGAGIAGKPAAVLYRDQLTVFARGADGTLRHWWHDGTRFHHDVWGEGLAGDPTVLLYKGELTVFARGADGSLKHWWFDGQLRHDTWGAGLAGDPVATQFGEELTVFARGGDNSLRHWWFNGSLHSDTWGTGILGNPAALVYRNELTVFARGTDGSLKHWWFSGSLRHDSWGLGISGNPAAVVFGDHLTVFARGSDNSLQHWWFDGQLHRDSWGGGVTATPSVTVYRGQELTVFARGDNGGLEHWWFVAGGAAHHRDSWGAGLQD